MKTKYGAHHISRETEQSDVEEVEMFTMYSMSEDIPKVSPIKITLKVNGSDVKFEVDTGCNVTIMNRSEYPKLWGNVEVPILKPCSLHLKTYTGERVDTSGAVKVTVKHKETLTQLPVVVVSGTGPHLLGRGWIKELQLGWGTINKVQEGQQLTLEETLMKHENVFKEELGTLEGPQAKIYVDKEEPPRFYKQRPDRKSVV